MIAVFSFVVICQVYRYRKVSTHVERLQAKWVILPLGLTFAQFSPIFVFTQPVFEFGAWTGWAQLSLIPTTLMFPFGIATAVLRYRLYDIERIVSRTVSYGLLTVLLFGMYATLVFVLRQLMPMQGDLAVQVQLWASQPWPTRCDIAYSERSIFASTGLTQTPPEPCQNSPTRCEQPAISRHSQRDCRAPWSGNSRLSASPSGCGPHEQGGPAIR